jgi:pimeloyl-ACP methyl ester carboxylesterase
LQIAARNWRSTIKLAGEPRWVDPGLPSWLHRISVPTQIIWGELDRLFPLAYGQLLARCLPAAKFSVLRNCGHLPHAEQPAALRQLIVEFAR